MNEQNLIPKTTLSKEEAKRLGSIGGKNSVKSRRKKKLLTQVYGNYLAKKFDVKTVTGGKKVDGEEFVHMIVTKVLTSGGSAAVSMLKEIREATQGSKVDFVNDAGAEEMLEYFDMLFGEYGTNDDSTTE